MVNSAVRQKLASAPPESSLHSALSSLPAPHLEALRAAALDPTARLGEVMASAVIVSDHVTPFELRGQRRNDLDPLLGWWTRARMPIVLDTLAELGVVTVVAPDFEFIDLAAVLKLIIDSSTFVDSAAAADPSMTASEHRLELADTGEVILSAALRIVLAAAFPGEFFLVQRVNELGLDGLVAGAADLFAWNPAALPARGVVAYDVDSSDSLGFYFRSAPREHSQKIDWQLILDARGGARGFTLADLSGWRIVLTLPAGAGSGAIALSRGATGDDDGTFAVKAAGALPPRLDLTIVKTEPLDLVDKPVAISLGRPAAMVSLRDEGTLLGLGLTGMQLTLSLPTWFGGGKKIVIGADALLTVSAAAGLGYILSPRLVGASDAKSIGASLTTESVHPPTPAVATGRPAAAEPVHGPGTTSVGVRLLRSTSPFNLRIGDDENGFTLDGVLLELRMLTDQPGIRVDVFADMTMRVGPLFLEVNTFGGWGGWWAESPEAHPAALDGGVHAPQGVAVEFTTEPLQGGGFLQLQENGAYAGAFAFRVSKFSLAGLAVFEDVGGAPSILVQANMALPAPIPLTMGFELVRIGGVLGINRSIDLEAVRSSVSTGAIGALFTGDVIARARENLPTLQAFFPAKRGSHVFGGILQLSWLPLGSGHLLRADMAIAIELPSMARIAIFGSVRIEIPDLPRLLQLRVDFAGGIDFTAMMLAFDASLVNSQILDLFQVTGDIALRLAWGGRPGFLLTAGGFHPSYKPEVPGIPTLQRLALTLNRSLGSLQIRAEAYFAVTSNTVQAGGKLDVRLSAGGFAIWGRIGFDTLIQYVPFHFDVRFDVSLGVAYKDFNLLSLRVHGTVSGPGPLRISAGIEIDILLLSIEFSHTFVIGADVAQPSAPRLGIGDAAKLLASSLALHSAVRRNDLADPLVALHISPSAGADEAIVVNPLAPVQVSQDTIPLDVPITHAGQLRFGTVADPKVPVTSVGFRATSVAEAGSPPTASFSPAQFVDVEGEAQRLALPSYETHLSGLTLSSAPVGAAKPTLKVLEPEVHLVPEAAEGQALPGFMNLRIAAMFGAPVGVAPVAVQSPRIAVHDELFGPIGESAIGGLGGSAMGATPPSGLHRTDPVTVRGL